ncbi:ABC-2 type transport system permease protein [Murinocardiopsis flavida]|uniref:ABC-2 type transport system permease protein n=1 Tax=Murinocardiopsis flavida TaxID=645275 RepID=A0A2P8DDR8_9ACTN|nr:ABC transporter permease [Murinocardiopsis flavida]PSK95373.1 ABC-2 type transport system permease protein [Murinocardiopsis flavida]
MSAMAGTATLARLVLRRDRWFLPLWTVFPAFVLLVFVGAFNGAFPTAESRVEYAETSLHNAAFTVTYGALQGPGLGELVTWRAGFLPVVLALISLLVMLRHTRVEEEAGRRELVAATAVGRNAAMAAALVVVCSAGAVLGALCALGLMASGLPTTGSWAYGLGITAVTWTFAAIGALVAQVTTETGSARVLGVVVIGLAFLARGVGDVSAQTGGSLGWLSWVSPISWAALPRPFSGERWWPVAVFVVVIALLIAAAVALSARRDLGGGVLHPRPGPAEAGPRLRSPVALAWRLQRGGLIGQAIGAVIVGGAVGGIAVSIGALMTRAAAGRELLERLGGPGTVIDQYLAGMMMLLGVLSCAFAVHTLLRMRVEERDGRAELLLAGPVDRLRWAAGHLAFALLSGAVVVVGAGTAMGLGLGAATGDPSQVPRVLAAALVQLPAAWLFTGLAFGLLGWLPRWAAATYAVALVSLFFGWISGELAPDLWIRNLSVFEHLPKLPGGAFTPVPLAVLTVAAAALVAAGFLGLRRRDLAPG